jgi:hypothetical protein
MVKLKYPKQYENILYYLMGLFVLLFISVKLFVARSETFIIRNVSTTSLSTLGANGEKVSDADLRNITEKIRAEEVAKAETARIAAAATPAPASTGRCGFGMLGTQPYSISVPNLGLNDVCVEKLSTSADGSMTDPKNIWNFGWWTQSSQATTDGLGVYNCHTGFAGARALCNNLPKLAIGAEIIIKTASGQVETFYVRKVEAGLDANNGAENMQKFFTAFGGATRAINFMTCSGKWVGGHSTERTIVYATK